MGRIGRSAGGIKRSAVMHVADILNSKGSAVVTVSSALRIDHLAQRLKLEGIGAAVVSEDGGQSRASSRSATSCAASRSTGRS